MRIRVFEPGDADALAALFHASVRQVGIRDYTAVQVAAWSPSPPAPEAFLHRAERGDLVVVAETAEGQPIGFADLESNGHIDLLYCRPDAVGTGVGSALYAALEQAAKARGIGVLFVEASEAARRLFARKGFTLEGRNDFERNGVAIYNYRMSKAIA